MPKRASGEGTLSRRKDKAGKTIGWRAAVTVGHHEDGSQDRRWVSGKTQAEVQDKLRALQADMHTGMVADTEGLTVADFMARWTEHKERDGVKPNTVQSYRDTVKRYILPHIGKVKLEKLRPLDVEHLLSKLSKAGKSAAMSAYTLRVLKMALRQAVRWQMLPRNVAEAVRPPKVERPEMHVWTADQVAAFLDVTQAHRMHAAFYLALMTGMRRGEVLGLKWADLDFARSRLTVKTQPCRSAWRRDAGQAARGQGHGVFDPYHAQHAQDQSLTAHGSALTGHAGEATRPSGPARAGTPRGGGSLADQGFVFASELGGPTNPDALSSWYQALVKRAGVPRIRFHDMRHTAASLMIQRGIPPKTVSERLGHADVTFTLRTYTHLYDDQREGGRVRSE